MAETIHFAWIQAMSCTWQVAFRIDRHPDCVNTLDLLAHRMTFAPIGGNNSIKWSHDAWEILNSTQTRQTARCQNPQADSSVFTEDTLGSRRCTQYSGKTFDVCAYVLKRAVRVLLLIGQDPEKLAQVTPPKAAHSAQEPLMMPPSGEMHWHLFVFITHGCF